MGSHGRFGHWTTALAALAAFAVIGAACGDSAISETAGLQATPAVADRRDARALPVTPVTSTYTVFNPAFEPLAGARAIYGEHNGTGYQIELPDDWNGEVVYFAHGFRGNPPELVVIPPPLRAYFIQNGFAWAASSYSRNGYEPGAGARDTYALRDVVARELGAIEHSYLYGQSMGGHVVTLSLEQYPTAFDGAFTECGVVAGNEVLDYFLSWGALAGYLTKVDLYTTSVYPNEFGTLINGQVIPALGSPSEPTPAGRVFASAIENMTGGPRPYFREGYDLNFGFNFAILVNAVANAGPANAAASNLETVYTVEDGLAITTDQLNREMPRIKPDPAFRDNADYPEFSAVTGKIERPLLTIHGTGDLFVPISQEQSYRRAVEAAGAGDLLVQRAVRRSGHCNFTDAERQRAFDDLVRWVRDGVRPAGEDLSGSLADAGREWTSPLADDDPGGLTVP